jgi:hypothetical protein
MYVVAWLLWLDSRAVSRRAKMLYVEEQYSLIRMSEAAGNAEAAQLTVLIINWVNKTLAELKRPTARLDWREYGF